MSYDPIQRAIDIQLSGLFNDYRPHNPADLIDHALDLKYHFSEIREQLVSYWYCEGYTQQEIGGITGITKQRVCQIIKQIKI